MNDNAVPINFEILKEVYGEKTVELFKHLDVTHFLDINKFEKEPDIGSIFLFGLGGCYEFSTDYYGEIYIQNGTLLPESLSEYIDRGQKYYKAHFDTEPKYLDDIVMYTIVFE